MKYDFAKSFSIALDEFFDSTDFVHVLLNISEVDAVFEITEELAAVFTMKDIVTDNKIFPKVKETITIESLFENFERM